MGLIGAIVPDPTRGNVTLKQYSSQIVMYTTPITAACLLSSKQAFLCTQKQSQNFELFLTSICALASLQTLWIYFSAEGFESSRHLQTTEGQSSMAIFLESRLIGCNRGPLFGSHCKPHLSQEQINSNPSQCTLAEWSLSASYMV